MNIEIRNHLLESLLRLPFKMAVGQIVAFGETHGKAYRNHLMFCYLTRRLA